MNKLSFLAACGLVALSATPARAAFVDGFDLASPAVTVGAVGYAAGAYFTIGSGIERRLATTVQANPTPSTRRAWSMVGGTGSEGAYGFQSDAGVDGYGEIGYRFDSLDLRGLTSFRVDFLSSDAEGTVALTLGDANADAPLQPIAIPVSLTPFSLTIEVPESFAESLDMARLTNLDLWIDTGAGRKIRIDKIESVPEPASMAVLALGAAGLLRRRKA